MLDWFIYVALIGVLQQYLTLPLTRHNLLVGR